MSETAPTYLLDGQEVPMSENVATALAVDAGPPPVPGEITNFQARAALASLPASTPEHANKAEEIHAALLAGRGTPEGESAWIAWEYANVFTRHGTMVNSLAGGFGISQEQLDQLFRAAIAIEA